MRNTLILRAALANTGDPQASQALQTFLRDNTSGVKFNNRKAQPGLVLNAAFDWQATLSSTAAVLAIVQALWAAYKKFIVPIRKKGKKNAFLVVQIQNESREFIQFSLGRENEDKDTFVTAIAEKIQKITISASEQKD
jgi:hypothetical protein